MGSFKLQMIYFQNLLRNFFAYYRNNLAMVHNEINILYIWYIVWCTSFSYSYSTESLKALKEKIELFLPKKLSHAVGTKIQPGIPSNCRIFESIKLTILRVKLTILRVKLTILRVKLTIWLSISSQFDSNILQSLWIPGRISVPPVTQIFRSKWLYFFFQWDTALQPPYTNHLIYQK